MDMMADNKEQKTNRIPVRFVDEEGNPQRSAAEGEERPSGGQSDRDLTPPDLGRESSYEGETEMQRRIDRGDAGEGEGERGQQDDADVAGGPPMGEMPEHREDQDEAGAGPKRSTVLGDEEDGPGAQHRNVDASAAGPVVAELVATRAELKRVEAERADLVEKLARRQADFENYRKRLERERGEMYQRIVGDIINKLLPVVDNLRRALDAETSHEASESEEFGRFLHGIELISRQLNDVLEGLGVQPVAAVGQPFDPHVHEAVATEATNEFEPDTVTQELVRGYRLGDKLLRPAMVKVATRQ